MRRVLAVSILSFVLAISLIMPSAAPSSAGGPLANCGSGQPYLWPSGGANIPFNPDQGDLGPLTHAEAVAAVQAAFDVWGNVPSSTVSYVNAGELPVDVDITNFAPYYNAPAPDGLSAIVFDDTGEIFDLLFGPGSGVLGFAGPEWGYTPTCSIIEGLSFLNGPAFTDLQYARDVMVHEFGHYANLAHTVVNGQLYLAGDTSGPTPFDTFGGPPPLADDVLETLYPFYFGVGSGTDTLEADDIAALSTLYPAPDFFSSTGTVSGVIYAPNGITRLTGVNVIARNVADPFGDAVSAISSDFTDSTSQSDPFVGVYTINGLTPGAQYAIYVDEILAGGFSTPPLAPLEGPEEFYNGTDESSDPVTDDPSLYTPITAVAGSPVNGIDIIFNAPPPGVIPLGDDDTAEIFLPFEYTICEQTFDSVFVNSNGNLTFGSGDTDFSESAAEFLADQPRIAPLWDDLNPTQGGTVSYGYTANTFTVRFEDVPEYYATGANTFEVTLHRASNLIDVVYGGITASDGLAGVSCGGAITSGFEEAVDLTSLMSSLLLEDPEARINLQNQPALFEQFGSGIVNDLGYETLLYNSTTNFEDNWAEPNNSLAKARRVKLPFDSKDVTRFTEIEPAGADVDYFRFRAERDTTLVAEIISGQLDSLIGLFDKSGNLVALDDDGGAGLLSKIVFRIPANGDYILAVSAYPDTDFNGDGNSGGRYVLDLFATDEALLDLGDDGSEEVSLGFSFPYQGSDWTSVWVNSNGNLTFGSGDTDYSESVAEFLADQPRIAPLWDDLNPSAGGRVLVRWDDGSATVRFEDVPEYYATGANSFSVTMNADGSVEIAYGTVTASDGLAGITGGGGAADPGPTDLSAAPNYTVAGTTYELFTSGNPFDLSNLVLPFE